MRRMQYRCGSSGDFFPTSKNCERVPKVHYALSTQRYSIMPAETYTSTVPSCCLLQVIQLVVYTSFHLLDLLFCCRLYNTKLLYICYVNKTASLIPGSPLYISNPLSIRRQNHELWVWDFADNLAKADVCQAGNVHTFIEAVKNDWNKAVHVYTTAIQRVHYATTAPTLAVGHTHH